MTGFRERSAYLAARVGVRAGRLAARLLPRQWLYRLSDILANMGFYLWRGFRTRSLRNVTIALAGDLDGRTAREIVRRSLRTFFRAFVEMAIGLAIPGDELRSEISVIAGASSDAALTQRNGIIVLSEPS